VKEIVLKMVANGFIIKDGYQEFVFVTLEAVVDALYRYQACPGLRDKVNSPFIATVKMEGDNDAG